MRDYEFSVGAGSQGNRGVNGQFVRVKSATAAIVVIAEDSQGRVVAQMEMESGMAFTLPDVFKTVRVRNDGAGAVTCVLTVGVGQVESSQLTGQITVQKAAQLMTTPDMAVAAATQVVVKWANPTRREIMITNLSTNTAPVRVGDAGAGAAEGIEVLPGSTVTLTVTDTVYVYNTHATLAQSVAVAEVYD